MAENILARHAKQLAAMRAWCHGRRFFVALEALEYAQKLHVGTRKDGVTPCFDHQLSLAKFLVTLEPSLQFPEETIAAAFLHDTAEDHHDVVSFEDLEARFGKRISDAVWLLTKKYGTTVKEYSDYFADMAHDPIASIVKAIDRAHNVQTMPGVFTPEKQHKYVDEVERWFLPMMKAARRMHPRQAPAYENVKYLLRSQVKLIRLSLGE